MPRNPGKCLRHPSCERGDDEGTTLLPQPKKVARKTVNTGVQTKIISPETSVLQDSIPMPASDTEEEGIILAKGSAVRTIAIEKEMTSSKVEESVTVGICKSCEQWERLWREPEESSPRHDVMHLRQ